MAREAQRCIPNRRNSPPPLPELSGGPFGLLYCCKEAWTSALPLSCVLCPMPAFEAADLDELGPKTAATHHWIKLAGYTRFGIAMTCCACYMLCWVA